MAKGQGGLRYGQRVIAFLAMILLTWATVGCAKPTEPTALLSEPTEAPHLLAGPMAEVSPPETLETLKQIIDAYTPQVRILSPRPGEVVENATVSVRFQVRGLPLFKDETWQLGPHLHVFLDDQPYQAVYDASEPLVLEDLAPGTHTLRVFASRPWHESFKNQGAFDQRTFHVFAPTPQNEVNASDPLLTYSRPQGTYGAEPIMLDFYLTNAPLHLSAQADAKDDLHDWRIRCTVNGQSFVFDQWQPIYLKGFQPGQNWVQLELIDETGHPIENRFNNTVRIIDYQPGGTDTLSRLVRDELDLESVVGIIDPTYTPPAPETVIEPDAEESDAEESDAEESDAEEPDAQEPDAQEINATGDATPASPPTPADPQTDLSATEENLSEGPTPAADAREPGLEVDDIEDMAPESADPNAADSTEAEPEITEPETIEPETIEPGITEPESAQPEVIEAEPPSPAPDAEAVPNSEPWDEPVPADEPLPEDTAAPLATDADSSQTQTMQPPAAPKERGKGMMKRWKNWAQQQSLPGFGTAPPETTPAPIPVYEVPAATDTLESSEDADSDNATPSVTDDPIMVMPELVEPYLTQPYMTEPRLDFHPLEPENGESGETESSDAEEPSNSAEGTIPGQAQTDPLKRPYI